MNNTELIKKGKTALGIEFGSTRIKAVLIDGAHNVLAAGAHEWENKFEGGLWTYSQNDILAGMRDCYAKLKNDVKAKYGVVLETAGAIGVSGMMHGYLVFDKSGGLPVPFRTWRNNNAAGAAQELTKLFDYPIPARWSIAHLYQAVKGGERHVKDIAFQTTLAGYIHWTLTGEKVIGAGEASGMLPFDIKTKAFDGKAVGLFDKTVSKYNVPWKLADILPKVLAAGKNAGSLTADGAVLLDPDGDLKAGIPFCPPEGDAGTGMVATNSVKKGAGNISAGTSVFSMTVLDGELSRAYPELDLVTTPCGALVAMAHGSNCTSDINAWIGVFDELRELLGADTSKNDLYNGLFAKALSGDADCGGLVLYNYLSSEHITGIEAGRPLFLRTTESKFNLANFMRAQIYSAFATLKIGQDILFKQENVRVSNFNAHGGIFKAKGVAQRFLAAALDTPVTVNATANEGGPWGMAVLAMFMKNGGGDTLADYLDNKVFAGAQADTLMPDKKDAEGFNKFMERYIAALPVVKDAVVCLKD